MAIATSALIQFCRRVATSARAGIDIRRIFEQESGRGLGRQRQVMQEIYDAVSAGGSVTEAMRESKFFPPLVVEMTAVGEQTGKLDEVYFRLGDHYEHILQQWRAFLFGIWWPALELGIAVLVIGLMIWLPNQIMPGMDILGMGLVGTRGLIIYVIFLGFVSALVGFIATGFMRNWFGPGPVRLAMKFPLLGPCFEAMALSRMSWALAMAHESGMSAQRTAVLALNASQNIVYSSTVPIVAEQITAGREFHEAFGTAAVFSDEFLTNLQTAELAGTVTESMMRVSSDYEEKARNLLKTLTVFATFAIMGLVGLIIIVFIFKFAFYYINMINRFATDPLNAEF